MINLVIINNLYFAIKLDIKKMLNKSGTFSKAEILNLFLNFKF